MKKVLLVTILILTLLGGGIGIGWVINDNGCKWDILEMTEWDILEMTDAEVLEYSEATYVFWTDGYDQGHDIALYQVGEILTKYGLEWLIPEIQYSVK